MRYPFLNLATVNAPYIDQLQEATRRVVASGWYIGGPECQQFEENMATLTDTSHCVGVSNGLDALRLIFRGLIEQGRLKPGDKVLVPANTYIASVLAVTDAGLEPVFVEPRLDTLNIDPERVFVAADDPAVRALLVVHLYGRVAWDAKYNALADAGLLIVEDVAQAIGAVSPIPGVNGTSQAGSLGHAAGFSFYPTKNIGALGDAGCVTTNDPELARTVRALANYGSYRRYHNEYQGFNCRLDPIQAACINVKLPHTAAENALRRALARVYDQEIHHPAVSKPLYVDSDEMVWHQYVILSPERDRLRQYLTDRGVGTDINYPTPPHLQPCYANSRMEAEPTPTSNKERGRLARVEPACPLSRMEAGAPSPDVVASPLSRMEVGAPSPHAVASPLSRMEVGAPSPHAVASPLSRMEVGAPSPRQSLQAAVASNTSLPLAEQIAAQCLSLPITRCTTVDDARAIARILNAFPIP